MTLIGPPGTGIPSPANVATVDCERDRRRSDSHAVRTCRRLSGETALRLRRLRVSGWSVITERMMQRSKDQRMTPRECGCIPTAMGTLSGSSRARAGSPTALVRGRKISPAWIAALRRQSTARHLWRAPRECTPGHTLVMLSPRISIVVGHPTHGISPLPGRESCSRAGACTAAARSHPETPGGHPQRPPEGTPPPQIDSSWRLGLPPERLVSRPPRQRRRGGAGRGAGGL